MTKLRLIQCGVGGHGKYWITRTTAVSPDFEVVAIADINESVLREAGDAANVPVRRQFGSLRDALAEVEADAVLDVTPPAAHLDHARLTFERGLHLMTEKPIADTLEHALEMVRLADVAGRQFLVSQNYRYRPSIQTLRHLIAEQAAGEFGHGHLDFYLPAEFSGSYRETMKYPLLLDMAIHHLDLIRYVTGHNIRRVAARSFRPTWSWYRHDPGLKMILDLDDDLVFSYSGDWSARGWATSWNGNWRLQCAEGSIHLDDDLISLFRSERGNQNATVEPIEAGNLLRTDQAATLHEFAEAIRTGQPAPISGSDNLHSFAAVIAGIRSTEEKRPVEVAELLPARQA